MRVLSVIILNTWKQFVRDKIFHLTLVVAAILVGFAYLLATLTIIESRKILLDFGFSALSLAGVLISVFLGIVAMAREIEQKIVYTIVTKPVSRSIYLLGKFFGAGTVLFAAHLLLSVVIVFILWAGQEEIPSGFWAACGLVFLENLIVLAFAFLVSILFSSVMAAGFTFSFFLVGRSSLAFQTMGDRASSPEIEFLAKIFYYIFPNLERFNLRDVVAYGQAFPESMVPLAFFYAAAYISVCLGIASWVFRRRDLP